MRNFARLQYNRMLVTTTIASVITFVSGIADTIFAGHLFGADALAGLNLVSPIGSLVMFVASTVAFGTAIVRSNAIGHCDRERMDRCCWTGLWAALATGGVLGAMFLLKDAYFAVMGVKGVAREVASAYCGGFWAAAAFTPIFLLATDLVSGDGGHRHSRIALIVNVAFKFGLSVPFARWFGVAGLAWASLVGMMAATCVLLSYFRSKQCTVRFRGAFSFSLFVEGIHYAVQDQLYMLGEMVKMTVVNKFVVMRFGEGFLPVVAVFAAVSLLTILQGATVNALQPVLGIYLGEGNFPRVRDVTRYSFSLTVVAALIASVAIVAFPDLMISLVGLSDPALLEPARLAVRIGAAFLVFAMACGFGDSFFLYTGHFGLSLTMVVLDSCLAPIILGVTLGFLFNAPGFWVGLAVAPAIVAVVLSLVLFVRYGNPYLLPKGRDENISVFDLDLTEQAIAAVSEKVMRRLQERNLYTGAAIRAPLIAEEALMVVRDRNKGRTVHAEVSLDLNDGVGLILRDDGVFFNMTDSDAAVSSLRAYLVASVMAAQGDKFNLIATGVNRNVFKF